MTARRTALATALAGALAVALWPAPPAAPQSFDAEGDPRLRLDWAVAQGSRPGTVIEGFLYNNDTHRIGLVQLRIEVLDEQGEVVATGRGWVYGDVPAGGRAPFSVRPPARGPRYRVTVVSFARISRDSP